MERKKRRKTNNQLEQSWKRLQGAGEGTQVRRRMNGQGRFGVGMCGVFRVETNQQHEFIPLSSFHPLLHDVQRHWSMERDLSGSNSSTLHVYVCLYVRLSVCVCECTCACGYIRVCGNIVHTLCSILCQDFLVSFFSDCSCSTQVTTGFTTVNF